MTFRLLLGLQLSILSLFWTFQFSYIVVLVIFLFIVLGFLSHYVSSLLCPVCASFISVTCNQRLLCESVLSPCLLLFLAHQL